MAKLKVVIFYSVLWLPLITLVITLGYYLLCTNLLQISYQDSRNGVFRCLDFVNQPYVFKFKPGQCSFHNIEFNSIAHIDLNGFRNPENFGTFSIVAIGDSHTYGWGVNDKQNFTSILSENSAFKTYNLGVPHYATNTELETLADYAPDAKYVIFQYCDNDIKQNTAFLKENPNIFNYNLRKGILHAVNSYKKEITTKTYLTTIAKNFYDGKYQNKLSWKKKIITSRNIKDEAEKFARILKVHENILFGKRLIVFESASFGFNSHEFAYSFQREISALLPNLQIVVLDSTEFLASSDYFFIDDHLTSQGHTKIARAIYKQIVDWESKSPILP